MIFVAQYEITDQEQPISQLGKEAGQRFTEDVLQLGMVINGPLSEPKLIDVEGTPWLQLEGEVRNAGQLLESAGIKATGWDDPTLANLVPIESPSGEQA